MSRLQTPSTIAAADWLLRRHAGEDVEPSPQFAAWLAESDANRDAWEDGLAAWDSFDQEPDLLLSGMRQAALEARSGRRIPRPVFWGAGSAVAAAAAILIAIQPGLFHPAVSSSSADRPVTLAYRTAIGDRRDVVLPDGSRISLDSDTAMTASLYKTHREIDLSRGQAYFAVAHDASRPFTVTAADSRITALGTQFDVLTRPAGMQVLLVSGRVAVTDGTRKLKLAPGERYNSAPDVGRVDRPDIGAALAWRQGYIEFAGEPLGRAVAEMNRYAKYPIMVKDKRIASLPMVTGRFKAGDTERFARALADIYSLSVVHLPDGSIELRRQR